jgi:hypothetical protein
MPTNGSYHESRLDGLLDASRLLIELRELICDGIRCSNRTACDVLYHAFWHVHDALVDEERL